MALRGVVKAWAACARWAGSAWVLPRMFLHQSCGSVRAKSPRLNKGLRAASRVSCVALSYLVTKSKIMGRPDFLLAIAYCSFGDWGPGGWVLFFFPLRRMGTGMWDEGSWERWDSINILGLPVCSFPTSSNLVCSNLHFTQILGPLLSSRLQHTQRHLKSPASLLVTAVG